MIFIVKDTMNYQRIYDQICQRAKTELEQRRLHKKSGGYYEGHHIVPVCLGGKGRSSDLDHENIALLTAREHFLCHWLLYLLYPQNEKLILAFIMMCNVKDNNQHRYTPSSRIIEYVKIIHSSIMKGKKQSLDSIEKNRLKNSGENNAFFGKSHSEESKSKMRGPRKSISGDLNPAKRDDVRKKISNKRKGSKVEKLTGKNHPFSKPVIQYDKSGNFIKEWESINLARLATNIPNAYIRKCCNGKFKSAGGFLWTFKLI